LAQDWFAFNEGRTIGQRGSEHGVIIRDEEYPGVGRITLERDGYTPFAITCGLYGVLAHTCFFSNEAEANQGFEKIKQELLHLNDLIPYETDPQKDMLLKNLYQAIQDFVRKF
jgi:hypothetical protein